MKTVVHHASGRDKLLHVETDGCVVNITCGLSDSEGHEVTSVEIIPDPYIGEEWDLVGTSNNRVIKREHKAKDGG